MTLAKKGTDPTAPFLIGSMSARYRLSETQLDSLQRIRADFVRERDALGREASEAFAQLVVRGKSADALRDFVVTTRHSVDGLSARYHRRVRGILGPDQLELWPPGAHLRAKLGRTRRRIHLAA